MNRQRLLATGFVLSVAVPLGAQTAGSIEIGGFSQFTANTFYSYFGVGCRLCL